MTVLELRFAAGRYHATPWGRHVNEGAVDWPPSPWRILRALVATWHLKAKADIPETVMRGLVEVLVGQRPAFELPPAAAGHTRHYMPTIEGKKQKPTKVFDTFLHLAGPLRVGWEVTLNAEQRMALELLCHRLGYFGRAESVVEAILLPENFSFSPNARFVAQTEPVPANTELIRLLVPLSPAEFKAWRADQMASARISGTPEKSRRPSKDHAASLPKDIFEALHADTGMLQAARWVVPPGSQFADYIRPADAMKTAPGRSQRRASTPPTVARFAVSSTVLPRLLKAVSVAERIHQALLARFPNGNAPAVLSGRDAMGRPLSGHRHLHIFCEVSGIRDTITHVTLFARDGFDSVCRHAIESLQKVWGQGGHDLQLVLLGFGDEETFTGCQLFGPATVWRSLTPFVPTRHPKTHRDGRPKLDAEGWWVGSPEHDLRRLIGEAGLPLPTRLERLQTIAIGSRRVRPLEFQVQRFHGVGKRGSAGPLAFQLTFPEPVCGPLTFGYATHFGLGLFVPLESVGS